jgi:hypothetical protein
LEKFIMVNLPSRKANVKTDDGSYTHGKDQAAKGGKRRQSRNVSRDKSGPTVVFSGLAASAAALDAQGGGPVVPALDRQRASGRGNTERLGSEFFGGHSDAGLASNRPTVSGAESHPLHHQGNAARSGTTERRAEPGGLTPAKRQLVEVGREKARAEFLERRLASDEEARVRQTRQLGAFFTERNAWLDATAKAVRPGVVKFFAYVLFRARDGQLVRCASREELAKQMRMHENTVRKATKVLVAAGKLRVFYRYDPKTRRNEPNEYRACGYTSPRKPRKEKSSF